VAAIDVAGSMAELSEGEVQGPTLVTLLLRAIRDETIRMESRIGPDGVRVRFFDPSNPTAEPLERLAPRVVPADLAQSERDLKAVIVGILEEEYGRRPTLDAPIVASLYARLFERFKAIVLPVSSSDDQAQVKAEWFTGRCMRVLESRARMTRDDFVALVEDIARTKVG
jgi:hypothetical protein